MVYYTCNRKVVSSTHFASSIKFHIPQEKAISHYVCIDVCSDHPDISDLLQTLPENGYILHMEKEAPHYVCGYVSSD